MFAYIDIETLPAAWSPDRIREHAASAVPANYTKHDTIAKWIDEHADEAWRRTALDSLHARILCIGVALEDEPVEVCYNEDGDDAGLHRLLSWLDERLRMAESDGSGVSLVGHNIAGFDLPMLLRSAWRLNHPVASQLPRRPRDGRVVDTGELWRATDPAPGRTSLAKIATFLGLGEKAEGLDGSKVYDAWHAGEHDRIRRYCAADVELVREIHGRIW